MYSAVPENEWRKLRRARADAHLIRHKAAEVIGQLSDLFAEGDAPIETGLTVEFDEISGLGRIFTPFYGGRFRIDWEVGDELLGYLIAERQITDNNDEIIWEPVLAIAIPQRDAPYLGAGANCLRIDLNGDEGQTRSALYSLGMSLLYAFVRGSGQGAFLSP